MPSIRLTEPVSPRYIHINAATNRVHLLVPVVGGQEISTDNTCEATVALREFFDGGALCELNTYKEALAFDIGLLAVGAPLREAKETRLLQIEAYIEAMSAMRYSYMVAMTAFLSRPSNLYSIQLRPRAQDSTSEVVNPAFNVNRTNDTSGTPKSALYNAMHRIFPTASIAYNPLAVLTTAVLTELSAEVASTFEHIQTVLTAQFKRLFQVDVDFYQAAFKDNPPSTAITLHPLDKAFIDEKMGYGDDATPEEYIEALLGYCAEAMWPFIKISPFYKERKELNTEGLSVEQIQALQAEENATKAEQLSLTTQFFLGVLNVYCKEKGISRKNFGVILDASDALSNELISVVSTALSSGDDVEKEICAFCNAYADTDIFELSRSLNTDDLTAIRQTFERTYRTVTATKENPHMDDFMILDKEAAGEAAKFVTHQGAICVNFAEIVDAIAASANPGYFEDIRADFAIHPAEIPQSNTLVTGEVELDVETLLTSLNDEQFERLPQAAKDACRAHPSFQVRHFLSSVAKATPDETDPTHVKTEAEALLAATPEHTQTLLRTPGVFTDHSGRTFNCTAYEYAYWAKDTHMCRMLEAHMDEETKADMLTRIKAIEADGLSFQQNGEEHQSTHFDLTKLLTALQDYVDGFDAWYAAHNWAAMEAAWMLVGKAQRDLPIHIVNEYCRPDRSFSPLPSFNVDREDIPKETLPRVLTFYNLNTSANDAWFPLLASNSGLGFDFALGQEAPEDRWRCVAAAAAPGPAVLYDLVAIIRLDKVRTVDLKLSREHLSPPVSALISPNAQSSRAADRPARPY